MSDALRPTIWAAFKAEIDADCTDERGNNDVTSWSQARLHIILLTENRLRGVTAGADDDFHRCWYRFIATSQNLDADHPAQDRLVMQIMFARNLSTFSPGSRVMTNEATNDATNAHADPPFLAEDLAAAWQNDLSTMDVEQRTNFVGFIARLVAIGVGADPLRNLATAYVRDTLKHDELAGLTAARGNRCHLGPDVVEFIRQRLPATRVLLQYCGHRIVTGAMDVEELTSWMTILYAVEASFVEIGDERRYLREQARLAGNWLGTFSQMVGIDRVPRSS